MTRKSQNAYRTISEAGIKIGVKPHVLRFWESKFSAIRPMTRAGGRRYYSPHDIQLLSGIRKLLHDDGLTIRGVEQILKTKGVDFILAQAVDTKHAVSTAKAAPAADATSDIQRDLLTNLQNRVSALRERITARCIALEKL